MYPHWLFQNQVIPVEKGFELAPSKSWVNHGATGTPEPNSIGTIFSVADAIGKLPSGILSGNKIGLGSYSSCLDVKVQPHLHDGHQVDGFRIVSRLEAKTKFL